MLKHIMSRDNLQHQPFTAEEIAFYMKPIDPESTLLEAIAGIADYEEVWMPCTGREIPKSTQDRYAYYLRVLAENELRSNPQTYARLIAQQLDLRPNGLGNLVF